MRQSQNKFRRFYFNKAVHLYEQPFFVAGNSNTDNRSLRRYFDLQNIWHQLKIEIWLCFI